MKPFLSFLIILFMFSTAFPQAHDITGYIPETDPLVLEKLEQWEDLKFGLLMHWGPYSQWGIVESWSICAEDEGWCRRRSDNYTEYKKEYEDLQTTFNPVGFNPGRWAIAAKRAGMKYVVFTTKHHDGFSMFDTKFTDYRITDPKTPFHTSPKANITKEIFDAFRAEGLWTGAYFSKPDWHSDHYWWSNFATPDRHVNYSVNNYPERWENFVQFTHNQIMELMTEYGEIDILWLDGGWVRSYSDEEIREYYKNMNPDKPARIQNQDIRMDELVQKARAAQPGLIVVDRAVPGINQNYLTPENRIPDEALPYPWESCIIAGGGWSWTPEAKYMTCRQAVQMLVDIVAKGGNLLLNIAPGPEGQWHDEAYDLLNGIGQWMDINSEAIYGTRAMAPYKEGKLCITAKGDGTWYLYYLAGQEGKMPATIGMSGVNLPGSSRVELLGSKGQLKWSNRGDRFTVKIPGKLKRDPPLNYVWVFKVSF